MMKNRDEREKVIDVSKRTNGEQNIMRQGQGEGITQRQFLVMVEVNNQSFPENQTHGRDTNPINDNNIIVERSNSGPLTTK